jgi:hypothetical protein
MPRRQIDDEEEDGDAPLVQDDGEETGSSKEESDEESDEESEEESDDNDEERHARQENEEARDRTATEDSVLEERPVAMSHAVVPVVSDSTAGLQYREDDPSFNVLLQRMRRVEEAMGLPRNAPVGNGALQVHIQAPLSEFRLKIKDHSRCPTTGRKFVPGGAAKATECIKTRAGSFPHIIQQIEDEEGGGTIYHVITSNNILIVAGVHRIESGESDVKISERVLLERCNQLLRSELEAKGEFPLTELRMRMRLVAAHISHLDPGADPVGVGEHRWWDRDLNTEIEGQRDKPQLLVPSELSGAYTQAILNGRVTYSFKIRAGVTSYTCRAHKRCQFKFVVEPESEVLRTSCPNLTALSEPFWASAKYNAGEWHAARELCYSLLLTASCVLTGRPPKVESWVESELEGYPPVKYDMSRKRPRDPEPEAH